MGVCHEDVIRLACSLLTEILFPLFFWLTRDHSSLVESTYEEHLCIVALAGSSGRGTQFHLLAPYFLV